MAPTSPRPLTEAARWAALTWVAAVSFSVAAAEILLGVGLAALLSAAVRGELRDAPRVNGYARAALITWACFVAWLALTHFTSVDGASGPERLPKLYRFALVPLFGFLPPSRRFEHRLFGVLTLVSLVLGLQALVPFAAGDLVRARTSTLHYNTLSQIVASISLLLGLAALRERDAPRWLRVAWGFGAGVATLTLVGTLTRAAWIAWFSAVVLLVLAAARKRPRGLLLLLVIGMAFTASAPVRSRLAALDDIEDPEFTRRYDLWAMGREAIARHPWVGLGPGGVEARYDELKRGVLVDDPRLWPHLHDDVITIAAHHGLPAAALWMALALSIYPFVIWRLRRRGASTLLIGTVLSVHVFTLCGLLHDTLPIYRKLTWYLLLWGLLVMAARTPAPTDTGDPT